MLIGLQSRKIRPMVTLHHFTEPLWVSERGSWENNEIVDWFSAFVRKAVEALKPYCDLWITINEPNVVASSAYLGEVFPPGKKDFNAAYIVTRNMVKAHARAYAIIHEIQPEARVGTSLHYREFLPATWLPVDRWAANVISTLFNDLFARPLKDGLFNAIVKRERIPEAIGTQDFVGLNYYSSDMVRFNLFDKSGMFANLHFPKDAELSETGFIANIPAGMEACVRWGSQFGKPMIITENGVEDSQDEFRPRYLVEHLHALWRMINNNYPVEGYFHWSLVDNFEWERGWTQRFGLWGLDVESQARIRRPSVDLYAAICRENGISSEMVAEYAPKAMERLFPPA
jgi:beta-glucosidase